MSINSHLVRPQQTFSSFLCKGHCPGQLRSIANTTMVLTQYYIVHGEKIILRLQRGSCPVKTLSVLCIVKNLISIVHSEKIILRLQRGSCPVKTLSVHYFLNTLSPD